MMPFDYSLEWKKTEPERVLDVIKEVGIHRLANLDGCICCSFEIRNVRVEVCCGKGGERGCRLSSRSLDYPEDGAHFLHVTLLSEMGRDGPMG
jgi:hypothetical protein